MSWVAWRSHWLLDQLVGKWLVLGRSELVTEALPLVNKMCSLLSPTSVTDDICFLPWVLNLRATEAQQHYILAQMSWKLHSIWISKLEGRKGGKPSAPINFPYFPYFLLLGHSSARLGPEVQDVLQDKEHCWIPAQSEFKNKLLIGRIKANLTFTYMQNAECSPPNK